MNTIAKDVISNQLATMGSVLTTDVCIWLGGSEQSEQAHTITVTLVLIFKF